MSIAVRVEALRSIFPDLMGNCLQQQAGYVLGSPGGLAIALARGDNQAFHQDVPLSGKPGWIAYAGRAV